MSFVALLLTYLFFCHPQFLAIAAIILAIVLLFSVTAWGYALLVLIVVGFIAYKLLVG